MQDQFLKVSEVNGLIREVVNMGFPHAIWVCGEIQGYDRNRFRRHTFFELCEKDEQSKEIIARIGLVVFQARKAYLDQILAQSAHAFTLKDDIEVKFLCKIDFYPPHGAMRLIVESIDPSYTLGKIAQAKQKLIHKLTVDGTLQENKKMELPAVLLNVGLITADHSAAYNDFRSELEKSGYAFVIYLRSALMQGKNAESDICCALDQLKGMKNLASLQMLFISKLK